jgi:hypothetical protein
MLLNRSTPSATPLLRDPVAEANPHAQTRPSAAKPTHNRAPSAQPGSSRLARHQRQVCQRPGAPSDL